MNDKFICSRMILQYKRQKNMCLFFFSFFLSLYFFLFFFLFLFFYFFFLSFFHIFCRQTKIVCRLLVICCLKRFVWFCWMTLFLFFFIYKERFCKFQEVTLGRRIGFYKLGKELGAGNFSKVKLGVHVLTQGQCNLCLFISCLIFCKHILIIN